MQNIRSFILSKAANQQYRPKHFWKLSTHRDVLVRFVARGIIIQSLMGFNVF
jgi:hypothetical protein